MSVIFKLYGRLSVSLAFAIVVCSSNSLWSQDLAPQSDAALKKWLKKFPNADYNQDGKLTESEAREFRKTNKTAKATKRSEPERITLSGSSAGATMALWIALHDDLADPTNPDPIARNSTRVRCASPHSGTASIEPRYFKQHAGVIQLRDAIFQLFGVASQSELEQPETLALVREASPLSHADASDPPLILTYAGDPDEALFSSDASQKNWIHHVCLGLPLKSKYDELQIPCELYYKSKPEARNAEIDFLKNQLFR